MSRFASVALALTLLLALAVRARARTDTSTVLVLGGALGAQDARLVEALRIYTGDVDRRLVLAGRAPEILAPAVIDQLVEYAHGESADIVVWCGRLADGRSAFYALDVDARDLRETATDPLGAERAAEDVALKVRALLFRHRARAYESAPTLRRPPSAKDSPKPESEAAAGPPLVVRPSYPTPISTPSVVVARPSVKATSAHRLGIAVAYDVVVPFDPAWLRHGLLVAGEVRLRRDPLAPVSLVLDANFTTAPTARVRGYAVTVSDLPLGLGLVLTRVGTIVSLGAGPRATFHAFNVSADDTDGRAGAVRRYAVGLGGGVRADVRLATYMKVFLGATIEALVPKQQFTIAGQPALDTGVMVSTGSVGLEWLLF